MHARAHAAFLDYDGFAADVEDEPSNWFPTFPAAYDGAVVVCLPRWIGDRQYREIRASHENATVRST
jgi:hypothetical protein